MDSSQAPERDRDPLQEIDPVQEMMRDLDELDRQAARALQPAKPAAVVAVRGHVGPGDSRLRVELLRMARATTSILDLRRLLDVVLDSFVTITEAERGFVMLDWENEKLEVAHNLGSVLDDSKLAVSRSVLRDVARSARSVFVTNALMQHPYGARESVVALGLQSFSCVPMVHEGTVRGVCYTDSTRPGRGLLEGERDELEAFANLAAIAIVNAERHESLRHAKGQLEEENRALREQVRGQFSYAQIVGRSAAMQGVFDTLRRIEKSRATVLIEGETGTGKELVALAIHHHGPLRDGPLVTVNCGAMAESLLESELFGHTKGAFTDARSDRRGQVVAADGGTLFLDEIGDLPVAAQVKLLRVLQQGEVTPVGADVARKVNVRVIAATHRNLEAEVKAGRFRQDLFYRLYVIPIHLPPLRQRGTDVLLLADCLVTRLAQRAGKSIPGLHADVRRWLLQQSWPGNVRQLENALERAVTLGDDGLSLTLDLFTGFEDQTRGVPEVRDGTLHDMLAAAEAREVTRALAECQNVVARAAERLGISRQHLHSLIRKHGLRSRKGSDSQ